MAIDPVFAGAWVDGSGAPEWSRARVLGVRLRKFSLWHRFVLKVLDSPFVRQGAVTMWDLRVAAGVCRLRPLCSRLRKPWLRPAAIHAGIVLKGCVAARAVGSAPPAPGSAAPLNPIQKALQREVDAFLAYCGDYLQEPQFTIVPPESGTPKPPRGQPPEELAVVCEIMRAFPAFTLARAWGLPVGQANWLHLMALRAGGSDIDLVTAEEKKFQESVAEQFRWKRHGLTPAPSKDA